MPFDALADEEDGDDSDDSQDGDDSSDSDDMPSERLRAFRSDLLEKFGVPDPQLPPPALIGW